MKKFIVVLLSVLLVFDISVAFARGKGGGSVSVRGYTRKDGTYVQPHHRSAPDGNFYNNWSTKGNVNPYTGKEGTRVTPPDSSSSGAVYSDYPSESDTSKGDRITSPPDSELKEAGSEHD